MLWLFRQFWRTLSLVATLVGLLYLAADFGDVPEAFSAWAAVVGLLSVGQALAIFSVIALCYIFWIDLRPVVLARMKRLPPDVKALEGALAIGTPKLVCEASEDGERLVSGTVHVPITNGCAKPITYTIHKFVGDIDGSIMPDVSAPNSGGEIVKGENRGYTGGTATLNIEGRKFSGNIEFDVAYGLENRELHHYRRRLRFTAAYNPSNRKIENISWSLDPKSATPDAQ